jgi:putative ABC transport system permease protein
MMETLLQDLRYAFRVLLRKPGFTAIAVIALALGIGANSAVFSVVNAVLLDSLPYKEPGRLVMVYHTYPKLNLPNAGLAAPSYVYFRDNNNSFEQFATTMQWQVNLTGEGEPERLMGAAVSANFFPTLGVEPEHGRSFTADQDQPGNNRVVILSHGFWQRRFGGDLSIIGKDIVLDGQSHNVIGIMPQGFQFIIDMDIWRPIAFTPEQLSPTTHGNEYLIGVARLKPGTTFEQAQSDIGSAAEGLREFYGPADSWGVNLIQLEKQLLGDFKPMLLIPFAFVGCVLLIACANVANLMLARASARHKEMSVRSALGATRSRIIRQLLTESVLLAGFGGIAGLAVALLAIELLKMGIPADIAQNMVGWSKIGLDLEVLAFTIGVSLLTGIIFGLVPAIQASRPDLNESLKEGGRTGSEGARRNRIRSALIVLEVAIALVLLVGAGLLVRSFMRLQQVNPGFNPENVLTMQLSLPRSKYKTPDEMTRFYEQTLEGVKVIPGVQYAAVGTNMPMIGGGTASFGIEGYQRAEGEPSPHGNPHFVSPQFFETMRIPLLEGRYFNEGDMKEAKQVAIIDKVLADRYWPGQSPVGRRMGVFFEADDDQMHWREIVGVVAQIKQYGLDGKAKEQYYIPQAQAVRPVSNVHLVARSSSDPEALASSIKQAISNVDRDQPVFRVMTMERIVSNSIARKRFLMFLVTVFAGLALLLAAVGLYGVMSYSVTQRTHEIGIRMALGASSTDVLKMVVRQGMVLTGIGLVIGLAGAFAITRLLSGALADVLFGVGINDPLTFAVFPVVLAVVAIAASFIPARRATKVDPMIALRYE